MHASPGQQSRLRPGKPVAPSRVLTLKRLVEEQEKTARLEPGVDVAAELHDLPEPGVDVAADLPKSGMAVAADLPCPVFCT